MDRQALVLIVDDDPSLLRMLRVLLESEDVNVLTARNGIEALSTLDSSHARPDLVLLDMQMPVMDGRGFFQEFRIRGYKSPVIVLSAFDADSARDELGAEGSIDKPFDPMRLASKVQQMIAVG